MIRRLWLYATVAALLGVSACQDSEYAPDARSEEQSEILHAINDSMQHLSPTAIGAIKEQMSKANDSLTWYDYYLMYGRHYLLTDTPDSLLPYTKRTLPSGTGTRKLRHDRALRHEPDDGERRQGEPA